MDLKSDSYIYLKKLLTNPFFNSILCMPCVYRLFW